MEEEAEGRIIRIALIGPESTAKSTLAEQLATHYKTVWVPERSREYLKGTARKYTLADIEMITLLQLEEEQRLLKQANRLLFADTELIISKVWCMDVFSVCPDWIEDAIHNLKYDLYLLTIPDLEWIPDPLRENPLRRDFFFNWYEEELKKIGAEYQLISGEGASRIKNAVQAVERFLARNKN
jgi:NadR type nicotinamide-nucleotide adenylyltransferase